MNGKNRTYMRVGLVVLAVLLLGFAKPWWNHADRGSTLIVNSFSPPDSIDPGKAGMVNSLEIDMNVYDCLLTYPKIAGNAGAQLVPDLAVAIPKPEDGGRTFVFQMRTGIRFAPPVNRQVEPSDVKWTIERLMRLGSGGVPFYQNIVGASDYLNRLTKHQPPGQIQGIVTDDATHTITFHLIKPDVSFLNKVALGYAAVVPNGTKPVDLSNSGFASGTGPYMFQQYVPQKQILLVRNPNFHQWTSGTPSGIPDRIEIKLGNSPDNEITAIQSGQADYSQDPVPLSKLPELRTDSRYKPYLHEDPSAATYYFWMNTEAPPFNNLLVRQAVEYALDPVALVKLNGGTGKPSETILPPLIPGYHNFNLYPHSLAKAMALIKQSGITPGTINYWTISPSKPQDQYMQGVLDQLGFNAQIQAIDASSFYTLVGNRSQKAQIGFGAWVEDFPDGSDFIDSNLNGDTIKPTNNNNFAYYAGMDKQIDAADAMIDPAPRAKAWGALDEAIVKQAVWAPFMHADSVWFVSKRVHNFIDNPVFGPILDQIRLGGSGSTPTTTSTTSTATTS